MMLDLEECTPHYKSFIQCFNITRKYFCEVLLLVVYQYCIQNTFKSKLNPLWSDVVKQKHMYNN